MDDAHTLEREQRLLGTPDEVFAFFADARNLAALTPPLLNFRIVTPEPIVMGAGTLIRYRLRVHGMPISWLTEIKEWNPPYAFADTQIKGPYALWHHTHTFEAVDGGAATLMRDVVRYRVGFGPLGTLANALLVKRDVEAIFDYRAERIPALLAAG